MSKLKAIILAAGEGKRLRPLTNDQPKCMVKLCGQSLIEHQLKVLNECNISDISVVTGYKGNSIKFPNIKYFRNENYESTNMVETLFCARSELTDSVIVSYGDIVYEKKVLEKLVKSQDDFAILVDKNWKAFWEARFDDPLADAESLVLDENLFIKEIGQKTSNLDKIQGQYIGLMKFQNVGLTAVKEFYDNAKKQSKNGKNPLNQNLPFEKSYMTDLLQGLIMAGHSLKAIPIENGWLEVDSLNDYNTYEKMSKENTLSKFFSPEL